MIYAPKAATGLSQGFDPGNQPIKRFALKGLEFGTRPGSKVAPSGLIRMGELPRVNPGYVFLATSGHRLEGPITAQETHYLPLQDTECKVRITGLSTGY